MTALAAGRPPPAGQRRRTGSLRGTGALSRLALRRERVTLAIWVLAICATLIASFPALAALYPDQAARDALAGGIASTPAFVVLTGPVESTSLGGLTAWRYGMLGAVAVALMAVLTVVRQSRAEEETGRTELLAAGVVGRFAPLAAALVVAWGACLAIGVGVAAGGIAAGHPAAGSILLGATLAGPGVVFAAVAAITAQLTETARSAAGLAGALLALAFALRAVGDTVAGFGFASWLAPIGWAQQLSAYGADRAWVLALFAGSAVAAAFGAVRLRARRDLGRGAWPARSGRSSGRRMRSSLALAGRLQRGTLAGWTAGFVALGALTGGMAGDTDRLLAGNQKLIEIMHQLGGPGALTDVLLASMGATGGLLAAGYGIAATLRLATEESAERAAPVLATAVGRRRYMAGHLLFAVAGPAWLLLVGGLVTGLLYGATSAGLAGGLRDGLTSMLVQYPAALVLVGLAAAAFGLLPRAAVIAWAALGGALLLGQFGALLELPRAVLDLSPFSHVPQLPSAPMAWLPIGALAAVAAGLLAAGLVGFRYRDLGPA